MKLKMLNEREGFISVGVTDADGEFFGKVNICAFTISRMVGKAEREEDLIISFDCFPTNERELNWETTKITPLRQGEV